MFENPLAFFDDLPPDISHEGGEINDVVQSALGMSSRSSRKGAQSRRQRLERLDAHWHMQMPELVESYLRWKHGPMDPVLPEHSQDHHEFHVTAVRIFGAFFF